MENVLNSAGLRVGVMGVFGRKSVLFQVNSVR